MLHDILFFVCLALAVADVLIYCYYVDTPDTHFRSVLIIWLTSLMLCTEDRYEPPGLLKLLVAPRTAAADMVSDLPTSVLFRRVA